MHTPDWRAVARRAVPRRARPRRLRLSGARQRRGDSGGRRGASPHAARRARSSPTASSRDRRDRARRFARTASASRPCTGSSCCRSRCTRRSDSAALHRARRRRARARRPAAAVRLAGDARGRTVRVLVTGATGFTGGHLARALARARRRRVGRWCAIAARRRPRRDAGIELVARRPRAIARRSTARPRGVEVVYHIAAIYRQAGLPRRGVSRGQRDGRADGRSRPRPRAGVRRVVHCSTVGVHGDIEHPPANEDAPLQPGRRLSGDQARRRARSRARPRARHRHRGRRSRGRPASTVPAIAGC